MKISEKTIGKTCDGVFVEVQFFELTGVPEGLLIQVSDIVIWKVEDPQCDETMKSAFGYGGQRVVAKIEGEQLVLKLEIVRAQSVDEIAVEIEALEFAVEIEGHAETADAIAREVEMTELGIQLDGDDIETAVGAGTTQSLIVAATAGWAEASANGLWCPGYQDA